MTTNDRPLSSFLESRHQDRQRDAQSGGVEVMDANTSLTVVSIPRDALYAGMITSPKLTGSRPARPDIEGVKAMLFDALTDCLDTRGDTLSTSRNTDLNGYEKFVVAGPSKSKRWTYAAIRADKLAATVLEWFAAHYRDGDQNLETNGE